MKKLFLIISLIAFSSQARVQVPKTIEPSVLLYNISQNKIEYSYNPDQVRPIASITKLMTAMITLDYDRDLARTLPLSRRVKSNLPLRNYSREQLLQAMLVRSDNAAAETLANDYPGGREAFVNKMNDQAREWELVQTSFEDPSGLGANNISTVKDLSELLRISSFYWMIRHSSTTKQIAIETSFKKRIRMIHLYNTNSPLLFEFDNIVVSKTGLTSRAGWCVGMVVEQNSQQYAVIVLGQKSKQHRLREVERIMYNRIIDNRIPNLVP